LLLRVVPKRFLNREVDPSSLEGMARLRLPVNVLDILHPIKMRKKRKKEKKGRGGGGGGGGGGGAAARGGGGGGGGRRRKKNGERSSKGRNVG